MSDLINRLVKNSPTKHTAVLAKSEFFTEKDNIPTRLPILNIAFSGDISGGLSSGLTVFAGASKSFKTMLGLFCVKAYLDRYPEAVCVLYDSEGGITPEYLISNKIDPNRVIHVPIEHLEMLKFDMVKTLKEVNRNDKVIMLVDSIGNTASLKELEDALDEKTVAEMQRSKSIKSLFRMVTPSLIAKDVPCICIAHTYKTMELYSKDVISGGTGIMYSSNQAFIITKAQDKEGTDIVGWNFTINVEKSRFVREKSKLSFNVKYEGGVSKWSGLLDLALESGHVIKPSNGWYSRVNGSTGEVEDKKWRAKDTDSNEFWMDVLSDKTFNEWIKNRYQVAKGDILQEEDDVNDVLNYEDGV